MKLSRTRFVLGCRSELGSDRVSATDVNHPHAYVLAEAYLLVLWLSRRSQKASRSRATWQGRGEYK